MIQNSYYLWGFSALFKPISEELGLTRAATSIAVSMGRFEGGIESPLLGWLTDKFGPRWLVVAGVFLFGLALILMYFVNSLWTFLLVWGGILGIAFNMSSTVPMRTAISNWFVKKRGTAQSTQMVMSGLSAVLGLPLVAWLLIKQGWRITCVIGGIVEWLVVLPLVWVFVKQRRPEYYGLLPDGATGGEEEVTDKSMIDRGVTYADEVEEVEFSLRQALRTPTFWLLSLAQASHMMASPALTTHAIPFLTDRGFDPLVAAGIMSMRVLISLPGRVVGGFLADRVRKHQMRFIMAGAYLLEAIGTAVFLFHPTEAMIYVWFIVYGVGWGVGIGILNPLKGRYFGRKAYGSILGAAMAVGSPIAIAAPIYLGWVYDTTGSYMGAFKIVAITLAFSAVLAAFIRPPKPPTEVTDVRKFM